AQPIGAVLAGCTGAADGLVAGENTAGDRGRAPAVVGDSTADAEPHNEAAGVTCAAHGPVSGQGAIRDGQERRIALEFKAADRAAGATAVEGGPAAARVVVAPKGIV